MTVAFKKNMDLKVEKCPATIPKDVRIEKRIIKKLINFTLNDSEWGVVEV